jgi:hypothetical protein
MWGAKPQKHVTSSSAFSQNLADDHSFTRFLGTVRDFIAPTIFKIAYLF